jgi:ribosomal protein L34E
MEFPPLMVHKGLLLFTTASPPRLGFQEMAKNFKKKKKTVAQRFTGNLIIQDVKRFCKLNHAEFRINKKKHEKPYKTTKCNPPAVLFISCKISGLLVTIPEPRGRKSLQS